jgi:ABC-type branched-subunit amino acid transport system ATPase component
VTSSASYRSGVGPRKLPTVGADLAVRGLSKAFGGVKAVRDCTFEISPGTITGLIGPNGAGKTTAFNMINGVFKPTSGTIHFCGADITRLPPHRVSRAGIGRTFQVTRVFERMTVLENVVIHAGVGGIRALAAPRIRKSEHARACELLAFLGLHRLRDALAGTLSYGQRKLLELAGVLMAEPRLIMLDEPAGGVNPRLLEDIVDRIHALHESGVTFLIVEHNMDLVMSLCDSVVVMAEGHVLRQGTPREIQADDRVLSAYLGEAMGSIG